MAPELSVIMPVYNGEATLAAAIDSILAQSFKDFELVIVDDGSTDRIAAVLNRYTDPRIKLLINEKNIGLTRSLNRATCASAGQYIARQDADDVSMPERLQKQISFMRANPDVALLGTSRATLDSNGRTVGVKILPEAPDYGRLLRSNCFVHGSIMVRRAILDETGGYNEDFKMSQDYELWLRIAKTHRVMNLQEPLYGVRRHGNRVTLAKKGHAGLFKLLSINLSLGDVPQDVIEQIRRDGIEAYYEHLCTRDRLKYHQAVKTKCLRYKCYREAEDHLQKLLAFRPYLFKERLELLYVRMRQKQRR